MLKINNKVLKINGDWLNTSVSPEPPVPDIYRVYTSAQYGTITANPSSGLSGTEVTLSNSPHPNYQFNSYSITGSTLKSPNKFDILSEDVYVVGNFDRIYNVILNQTTGGTISAQPMSGINGTTVTLSNTPATNYSFNGYNISGSTLYDSNKFDISGSDVTCSGSFTFVDPIPPSDQITIGDTTWMNKDLTVDDGLGGIEVYEDGVYYTMAAAVRIANSIPGWRLPYRSEWTALTNYVSPNYARLWSGNASSVGFNAIPYGDIDYNTHEIIKYGTAAYWWMYNTQTSSYSGPGIAISNGSTILSMVAIQSGHEFEDYPKIPIRLVKDS